MYVRPGSGVSEKDKIKKGAALATAIRPLEALKQSLLATPLGVL